MEWIHNTNERQETSVPTPKLKVVTKISKWDSYKCIEVDGHKFISGYSDTKDQDTELYRFESIDNPSFLFALMELKKKLRANITLNQNEIEKCISEYDIDLIINFCKTYGLPFWCNSLTSNVFTNGESVFDCRSSIFHSVVPFSNENRFPVASFISSIKFLYNDFIRLVCSNGWQDDVNIVGLIEQSDILRIDSSDSGFYTPNQNPFVTYWDDKEKRLSLDCENLMQLSSYYLCILYQQRDLSGGYIKKCKKCGCLFVTQQSRQQFCGNPCTRQAYYAAKKRKESLSRKYSSTEKL